MFRVWNLGPWKLTILVADLFLPHFPASSHRYRPDDISEPGGESWNHLIIQFNNSIISYHIVERYLNFKINKRRFLLQSMIEWHAPKRIDSRFSNHELLNHCWQLCRLITFSWSGGTTYVLEFLN